MTSSVSAPALCSLHINSILSEAYECVFAEVPERCGFAVCNLDTGATRIMDAELSQMTTSFQQGTQIDPRKLPRRPRAAWHGWWLHKHSLDARLLAAAAAGDLAAVEAVLEAPADGSAPASVDVRDKEGRTPLHLACLSGHADVVRFLLDAGAGARLQATSGMTALHFASQRGHEECVRFVCAAAATDLEVDRSRSSKLSISDDDVEAIARPALQRANDGNLPIHICAMSGHPHIVTLLIELAGTAQLSEMNDLGLRPDGAAADVQTAAAFEALPVSDSGDSFARRKSFSGVLLRDSRADYVSRILAKSQPAAKTQVAQWFSTFPKAQAVIQFKDELSFTTYDGLHGIWDVQGHVNLVLHVNGEDRIYSTDDMGRSFKSADGTATIKIGAAGDWWSNLFKATASVTTSTVSPLWARMPPRIMGSRAPRTIERRYLHEPFVKIKAGPSTKEVGPASFDVEVQLGKGAFGEVWKVKHKGTGQTYAMKLLLKRKIQQRRLQRYALSERNILSYASHPYIVSLHYCFQTKSCLVMILQYCPGGNLQELIKDQGTLHGDVARMYTAEVLLALDYLHKRAVVYRDMKSENIVLDKESHAKLTDFGLSKEGVDSKGALTVCGTPAFMAPEILARLPHNHTVDIYGLGALLFQMSTGHPPFFATTREHTEANIRHARLEVPSEVEKYAAEFIRATMVREPSRRLGAACTTDAQRHRYFTDLDFNALERRELPMPRQSGGAGGSIVGEASVVIARPDQRKVQELQRRMNQGDGDGVILDGWDYNAIPTPPLSSRSTATGDESVSRSPGAFSVATVTRSSPVRHHTRGQSTP